MERFLKKYENFIYISVLVLLFAVLFAVFFLKYGHPLIDTGRELFIPYAMANLKTRLFADIICIYGPLPYIFNAIFVKIFGANFSVFYFIGGTLSLIFLITFYKISNLFLKPKTSFILAFFLLFTCIFSSYQIFNFILPYSFAMPYAIVFFALLIYFSLRFLKTKKPCHICLSAFFLGLCILSKFDFLSLVVPFLILLFYKKISFKNSIKALCAFILPFLLVGIYCLVFKITFQDIFSNLKFISKMSKSPSFLYFYKMFSGFSPNFERFFKIFPKILTYSLVLILPSIFLFLNKFLSKFKSRPISFIKGVLALLYFLLFVILFFILAPQIFNFSLIFCYIPLLVAALFLHFGFKFFISKHPLFHGEEIFFLNLFIFFFSLKVLFCLSMGYYGVFYLPFILLAFSVLVKYFLQKNIALKSITVRHLTACAFLIIGIYFTSAYFKIAKSFIYPVNTPSGTFYLNLKTNFFDEFSEILNDTKEPVLGLPEGLFFNFAFKKPYKIYPTTFTPMDFDTYGDEFLINQVKMAKPKIIFFTGRDSSDYGKAFICKDYGQNFCFEILKGYRLKTSEEAQFQVYERID